ncbi:hypothetical protein ACFZAD_14015 [Streptomyces iakyrus]|uniref:hypothetical protein n=1 Tax=Streptomyces iakyrus TaxID=68219 RepID=UPI0036E7C0FE
MNATFKSVIVDVDDFDVEGIKRDSRVRNETAILLQLQNEGDRDAPISDVEVELLERMDVKNCPQGAGGGYSEVDFAVAVPADVEAPRTLTADLQKYDYAFVEGGKTDALTVSIGMTPISSGQYPVLFKIRVIIHNGDKVSVASPTMVIAANQGLVDTATAQYRDWQDPRQPVGVENPEDRNGVLDCFARQAERIDKFIHGHRGKHVAKPVVSMRDEFRKSVPFNLGG